MNLNSLPPNVLNTGEVEDFLTVLVEHRPEHIRRWAMSVLRRWVVSHDSHQLNQCVHRRRIMDPCLFLASGRTREDFDAKVAMYHIVHDNLPDWARSALRQHNLWFWNQELFALDESTVQHWLDFMLTLPEREIRMTVPDVIEKVAQWDAAQRHAAFLGSLEDGTENIAHIVDEETGDSYKMVQLHTKQAYDNEAAMMRNCVSSIYWNRRKVGSMIYSVRKLGAECSIASVEIVEGVAVQIEGPKEGVTAKADPLSIDCMLVVQNLIKQAGFTVSDKYKLIDEDGCAWNDEGDDPAPEENHTAGDPSPEDDDGEDDDGEDDDRPKNRKAKVKPNNGTSPNERGFLGDSTSRLFRDYHPGDDFSPGWDPSRLIPRSPW